MRNIRDNKGFTLIELMIVVVIIGILAAIAIPKFTNVSKSAKEAEAEPALKQIYSLNQTYYQRNDTYGDTTALKTVGWSNPDAKYYTFTSTVAGTGTTSTYCAAATPKDATVVDARSIDQKRNIYPNADCSGTPLTGPDATTP